MRVLVQILVLTLLSACSTPTVYIVHQGVAKERLAALTEQLEQQGLSVEASDALVPGEFPDVALASNPSMLGDTLFTTIEQTLDALGWDAPKHFKFAQGNHYYRDKNIGLYLRNPEVRLMPPIMGTRGCIDFSATIEYFRDRRAVFEYEHYNADTDSYEFTLHEGRYRASGDQLFLYFEQDTNLQLTIHQDMVDTHVGKRPADFIHFPLSTFVDSAEVCRFDAVYE